LIFQDNGYLYVALAWNLVCTFVVLALHILLLQHDLKNLMKVHSNILCFSMHLNVSSPHTPSQPRLLNTEAQRVTEVPEILLASHQDLDDLGGWDSTPTRSGCRHPTYLDGGGGCP